MAKWTKEEAAASLRQLQELGAEAKRLSAVPLTEEEGSRVRSRLATCSLPVSEAEALWLTSPSHCAEASEASLRRVLLTADGAGRALKELALEEMLRRHAARATERQPEENVKDAPRGGL